MKKLFLIVLTLICGICAILVTHVRSVNLINPNQEWDANTIVEPVIASVNNQPWFPSSVIVEADPPLPIDLRYDKFSQSLVLRPKLKSAYAYGKTHTLKITYFGREIGNVSVVGPKPPVETILEENERDVANNYPLAAYMPYKVDNLTADYGGPKQLRIRTSISEDQAKKIIMDFAESVRVDMSDHTFIFQPLEN